MTTDRLGRTFGPQQMVIELHSRHSTTPDSDRPLVVWRTDRNESVLANYDDATRQYRLGVSKLGAVLPTSTFTHWGYLNDGQRQDAPPRHTQRGTQGRSGTRPTKYG